MEKFTQFYTDNETGMPVRFMIKKYDINFEKEFIKVYYAKQTFNSDESKMITSIDKSYEVRDEVFIPDFTNPDAQPPTNMATDFTNWVNYIATGVKMIDLFVGSTLPRIVAIEGVS